MDDESSDCSKRILLDTTSRTPGKSIGTHSDVLLDVCCERLEGPVAGEGFRAVRHDDDCVEGRVRNGGRLRETSRQVSALTPIILMLGDVPTQLVRLKTGQKPIHSLGHASAASFERSERSLQQRESTQNFCENNKFSTSLAQINHAKHKVRVESERGDSPL